jgi:hypothetical protein
MRLKTALLQVNDGELLEIVSEPPLALNVPDAPMLIDPAIGKLSLGAVNVPPLTVSDPPIDELVGSDSEPEVTLTDPEIVNGLNDE